MIIFYRCLGKKTSAFQIWIKVKGKIEEKQHFPKTLFSTIIYQLLYQHLCRGPSSEDL